MTLARQPTGSFASASSVAASVSGAGAGVTIGGGAGVAGGSEIDHIYRELLRRLREEREQLGQAVSEPF